MSQQDKDDNVDFDLGAALGAALGASLEPEEDPIPEELSEHAAAEAEALKGAVLVGLKALIAKELVEVEEDNMELLAAEMAMASLEARDPRHLLKKLRKSLLNSDLVEEVYGDNRVLESAFRRALGG